MRKIWIIISLILITETLLAQSPEKMSYQAVIRNSNDDIIINTQIGMQISILQDNTNGNDVYTETQTPTSNASGIVSIEIGGENATIVSGDFTTIDWSNGPYFIQIETDPTGGTNYTITGTSQLLSVPYALHAKTAEIFTGTFTELDGSVTNEIQDLQLLDNILSITNNNSATEIDLNSYLNTQDLQLIDNVLSITKNDSATEIDLNPYLDNQIVNLTAGDGIIINGTYPNFTIAQTQSQSEKHYIGELIGSNGEDGIVFWVDHTGEHGLICSNEDLNSGAAMAWSDISGTTVPDGALSQFNGLENTIAINSQSSNSVAGLCLTYSTPGTSVGDWYLPSIDEISKIYHVKYEINKAVNTKSFELGYYWSSTEHSRNYAWYYSMDIGYSNNNNKNREYYVRAIREF